MCTRHALDACDAGDAHVARKLVCAQIVRLLATTSTDYRCTSVKLTSTLPVATPMNILLVCAHMRKYTIRIFECDVTNTTLKLWSVNVVTP